MRIRLGTVALLAACYQPSTAPGAPCGPNGECPSGLTCIENRCLLPGTSVDDAQPASDAAPDGDDVAIDAPAALGPWGTPVDLNFTIGSEADPSMTQDRLTLVFMSESTDNLYIAKRQTPTGTFTTLPLGVLNSASVEKSPEISPDGLTIYFVSNRTGENEIYRSTFATLWSLPTVDQELSTGGDDQDVAISPDGLTAIVVVDQATNRFRFHTRASTAQPFGAAVEHPELAVTDDATAPSLTNNGEVVYLHAGATRDIYVATKKSDGTYTTPVPVNELNTGDRDASPFVLQDNKHMLFERTGDIYETSRP